MKFFKRAFIALAAALIGLSAFTACNSNSNSNSKSNEQSVAEVTTEVVTTVVPTTTVPTTIAPTTIAPTTIEPTTVKTTQPTTETTKVEATENEKSENDEDTEDGSQSRISSNVDGGVMDAGDDYDGNEVKEVKYDAQYSPDEFRHSGVISWGGYQWTYYSELILPGNGLNIPCRHTTEDGYVCDGDGYVVLAADLNMLPRYSVVDTPFGREGKVYDTGCAYGVLDVYVGW